MRVLAIMLLCVVAACGYGVAHDLVTAHVCVEYFSVAHPRVLPPAASPAALALAWGAIATWWMGALLSVPLVAACRWGGANKRDARWLAPRLGALLAALFVLSMAAGLVGYVAARNGWVWLVPPWSGLIPPERHARFLFDVWAHWAAYGFGALGGLGLAAWVAIGRRRTTTDGTDPASGPAKGS